MAEHGGLIGGSIGGEEAEAAEAEATANLDPVAAALATNAMERGQLLDPRLASYLAQQEKLVGIQTEHLHEQREIILTNLKLKRWHERIKLLFQLFAALVGATVLAVLGMIVWEAASSHALVIEPFSVPPDFAQQGLTGQTIARQFRDRLTKLQKLSGSARAPASYENSWGKEVKVEIPEIGVSLGEIERFLRERLGHDTHITGEVYRAGPKLTFSVRVGEDEEASASGDSSTLDSLIENVAEGVFERTEPYRNCARLAQSGSKSEAMACLRRLAETGSREDRIWAWVGLNSWADSLRESQWDLQQGLKIDPEFSHLLYDLSSTDMSLGDEEGALQSAKASLRFSARDRGRRVDETASDWEAVANLSTVAWESADFRADIATLQTLEGRASPQNLIYLSSMTQWSPYRRAVDWAALHDPARAQALLSGTPDDLSAARAQGPSPYSLALPYATMAAERNDWAEVARQIEPLAALPLRGPLPEETVIAISPGLAVAYAHLGRLADARALLQKTAADCYACMTARAVVESLARNWTEADRLFAQADRLGPSLPRAQQAWGESRLVRGDLAGAATAFSEAAKRGPNWADPVKRLGDIAARRGLWRDAMVQYDKAIKITPDWKDLQQARVQAASHLR